MSLLNLTLIFLSTTPIKFIRIQSNFQTIQKSHSLISLLLKEKYPNVSVTLKALATVGVPPLFGEVSPRKASSRHRGLLHGEDRSFIFLHHSELCRYSSNRVRAPFASRSIRVPHGSALGTRTPRRRPRRVARSHTPRTSWSSTPRCTLRARHA